MEVTSKENRKEADQRAALFCMKNDEPDFVEVGKQKVSTWFGLRPKINRYLNKHKHLRNISIIIVVTAIVITGAYSLMKAYFPVDTSKAPIPTPRVEGINSENPIEKRVFDQKEKYKCAGARFDIISDLSSVGGENFIFPDASDNHVASPAGNLFQGSQKTSWECNLPLIATISATPEKVKSIGLFTEFENVFRVVVGDGDRRSIKIEKNDSGDRGAWTVVYRKYIEELQINREITLTIKAKTEDSKIHLWVGLSQPGLKEPIILDEIPYFSPQGISVDEHTSEKVRIGINDSFYKNQGTWVRLGTLSIVEGEW